MIDKKVYLASPFFNDYERQMMFAYLNMLRQRYSYVYAPIEHTIPNAWDISNKEWGRRVFEEDVKAIDESDVVFVLDHGHYSDAGTAWECGYAYGKGKEVHHININEYATYSLMMVNGATETTNDIFGCEVK